MAASTNSKTVQDVYQEFEARRTGLLKAFNEERDKFLERVTTLRLADNPDHRYCLFGLPDRSWRVEKSSFFPQNLPNPVLGTIQPIPDDQEKMKDWWFELAMQADSWLLEFTFFFAYEYGYTLSERNNLYGLINSHPTIVEIIERDQVKKQSEEKALDQAEEGSVETALDQAEKESEKKAMDVDQAEKESEEKAMDVDPAEKESEKKAVDEAEKEPKEKALDQAEKESKEPSSSSNSGITSQTILTQGGDGGPFIDMHYDGPLPSPLI